MYGFLGAKERFEDRFLGLFAESRHFVVNDIKAEFGSSASMIALDRYCARFKHTTYLFLLFCLSYLCLSFVLFNNRIYT